MAKSQLEVLEERNALLEGKVTNLLTERSRLLKDLRKERASKALTRMLVEELEALVVPLDPLPPVVSLKTNTVIEEDLALTISDVHGDEVVNPEQVGGVEKYDFPVCLCRAEKLVDSVLNFTQKTLSNYRFQTLHIFQIGDFSNGSIHDGTKNSYYQNDLKNCLALGGMFGLIVRDLAPFFRDVKIINLSGNHGRRTAKKDFHSPEDSWDWLIANIAKMSCSEIKNVEWLIPNSYSLNYEVLGHGFHLNHGDMVKSWCGLPHYGFERKTRRLVAMNQSLGIKSRYFIFGHHHQQSSIADLNGELFVNGSWAATNPYSYDSFSSYREPSQLLMGIHKDHGVTWRLPVKLRDSEKEKEGPSRYNVILASESL